MSEALKILVTRRITELNHWIDGQLERKEKVQAELETTTSMIAGYKQERDELAAVLDGIYAREVPE